MILSRCEIQKSIDWCSRELPFANNKSIGFRYGHEEVKIMYLSSPTSPDNLEIIFNHSLTEGAVFLWADKSLYKLGDLNNVKQFLNQDSEFLFQITENINNQKESSGV